MNIREYDEDKWVGDPEAFGIDENDRPYELRAPRTLYVVIENTPGYLPEDDEPAEFETQREALRYMIERMRSYRDEHEDVGGWIDRENMCGFLVDEGRPHDLGRAFEVHTTTEEA